MTEDVAKRISEVQTESRKGCICCPPCCILLFIGVIMTTVWSKVEEPFSTNRLAFPVIMVVCIAVACLYFAGQCVHSVRVGRKMNNMIQAAFAPWEGKGVKAYYNPGGEDERAGIIITVPPGAPGAQTVGAPQQNMMQVMVPSGASPGQVLQVQAPNGQILQAAIPQGANPGMSFSVVY